MNKMMYCALGLAAMSATQASEVGRWYVAPQVGGVIVDDDRGLDDGDRLFGIAIGKHLSRSWSVEMNLNGAKIDGYDPYAASMDVLRVFRRDQSLSPVLTFGVGAIRNDLEFGRDNTDAMAQAGVGLLWTLGENRRGTGAFSLRPEIKARWQDAGGQNYVDYIGTLGFQFSFGTAPVTTSTASNPEPAQVVVASAVVDGDGDGVVDAGDRCLGTSRGVAVDEKGCTQQGAVTLVGVLFENASSTLVHSSTAALDRVAADLVKHPQFEIEVQGHTDSIGSNRYNLRLSQQRADAVREYLLQQGARASQVSARGYGEAEPVSNNESAEGRAKNRRVVMKVLRNPGAVEVK